MRTLVPGIATAAAILLFSAHGQPPAANGKAAPKGAIEGRLTWFDRQGKMTATSGDSGIYRTLTISPDGKQIAAERTDPQTQNRDIWLIGIANGKTTRFTSNPGWEAFPTWSPDGSRIVFTSNRTGVYELYRKATNGTEDDQLFYRNNEGKGPTSWSPDGRYLIYYSLGQPTHIRLLAADGPADRKAVPIVDPQFSSITARFSPDGRWIAYSSNESGTTEVSVRPFDSAAGSIGAPTAITKSGGRYPLWRGDGKELFYIAQDGTITAVDVDTTAGFKTGTPKPLFKMPDGVVFWDVLPDGTRFLMPVPNR